MNKKLSLFISLAVSILCVIAIMNYVNSAKSAIEAEYQKVPILVSTMDIPKLSILQDNMVTMEEVPKKYAQPGALGNILDIRGKIADAPIRKGETLTSSKLVLPSKKTGLSFVIEEGKRAATIAINDVQGVAGLIRPFDRVDVMLITDHNMEGSEKQAKRIFMLYQDVTVLATGQNLGSGIPSATEKDELTDSIKFVDEENKKYVNVTLSVTPKEAMGIMLAQAAGELWLSLRPAYSSKNVALEPMYIEDVTGTKAPVKQVPRPAWMSLRNSSVNF